MKKYFLLLAISAVLSIGLLIGKPVDMNTATAVVRSFAESHNLQSDKGVQLVLDAHLKSSSSLQSNDLTNPPYYVYNVGNNGFVIVAGDDNVSPILAFSDEGAFNTTNIPPNVAYWLNNYQKEIQFVIDNNIVATPEIRIEWENYLSDSKRSTNTLQEGVAALMKTKWNQMPYYNDLCPQNTPAGCVATAMAQIMKYWNYPPIGKGSNKYASQYGMLSAQFDSVPYFWESMPNSIDAPNNPIAIISYHCGISVNMHYAPAGSGAFSPEVVGALKTKFGYKSTAKHLYREQNATAWLALLKAELDAGRPLYYTGSDEQGNGHAFVFDGYAENNYFHVNWGWGGSSDGYYVITMLNPGKAGAGSGEGVFNHGQGAIIGIEPDYSIPAPTIITLVAPENKAEELLTESITFTWNKVSSATQYMIKVGTDVYFKSGTYQTFTVTDTTTSISTIPSNSTLYWQVVGYDANNKTMFSNLRQFTTQGKYLIPDIPVNVAPENNIVNVSTGKIKFTWHPSANAVKYTFKLGTSKVYSAGNWKDYENLTDTAILVDVNEPGLKYYWRVQAFNKENAYSGESSMWNFSTTNVPPTAPTLVAPLNKAVDINGTSIKFEFTTSCRNAVKYIIELDTTNSFNSAIFNTVEITGAFANGEKIEHTIKNLESAITYYWRVIAYNSEEVASDYSEVRSFSTQEVSIYDNSLIDIFTISPNPANNKATLNFTLLKDGEVEMEISAIAGNTMQLMSPTYFSAGRRELHLDINQYPAGSYIVRMFSKGKQIATANFVVVK